MKNSKTRNRISDLNDVTPFLIFLLIVVFFGIATQGQIFSSYNLKILIDQSITTLVAGLGMIFVIALGGTDITTGSVVAVAGFASFLIGCSYGVFAAFMIAVAIGAASGFLLGYVNAKCNVPSFMASLAIGNIALRGVSSIIIQKQKAEVIITPQMLSINDLSTKLPMVIVMLILVVFLFHYTPFGHYCRAIGENEVAVKYAGINVSKIKIFAFVLSGIMAGFAAVFSVSRASGVQSTLGAGFEMNVMMAIFVAGVPVSGGMGAKIYKLLLGAFSLLVLQTGMILCGLSGAVIQGVRGLILLGVVYLSIVLNQKGSVGIIKKAPKALLKA